MSTDVAIEGDGFFIVDVAGEQLYSRAGAFQLNSRNDLVTISGGKVLGFDVDASAPVYGEALALGNEVADICSFRHGGFEILGPGDTNFDGVLANIYSDVIVLKAPQQKGKRDRVILDSCFFRNAKGVKTVLEERIDRPKHVTVLIKKLLKRPQKLGGSDRPR